MRDARTLERKVRSVWASAPDVGCKGLCSDCCGPVLMSPAEERVLADKGITIDFDRETLVCDKLVLGRCSIYDDRPLICRMWGGVDYFLMRCPHGCATQLSNAEAAVIFAAMENLERRRGGHR